MSRKCKSCGSFDTFVNLPGDRFSNTKLFEEADGRMTEDTEVPYKCNVCGYGWKEIIRCKSSDENRQMVDEL